MNRVVVAARSASANTYLLLYTYIMFHYTHTLCVHSLYALEEKAPQSEPQNLHFNYLTPSVTLHKTSCIFTHTFLKISCVQTHHVDAVGYGTCLRELLSMFVFYILQCIRFHDPGYCPGFITEKLSVFWIRTQSPRVRAWLAKLYPQKGHIIRKDTPKGRICVYMYRKRGVKFN